MAFRLTKIFVSTFLLATIASAQSDGSDEQQIISGSGVAGAPLTTPEQQWLNEHRTIRWGVDPSWPPFSHFDGRHKMTGIDADIVQLAAARVGLSLTLVKGSSWSEVLAKAKSGEVDLLSATAETPERLEKFEFTRQYGVFPVVIITKEGAPFLTPTADLRFLIISAPRDHVVTLRLQRDYPTAHFVLTDTAEQAIKLVSLNKADVTVENLAVACRVIRTEGLNNLKIAGVTRYEFPLRIAVRKDEPELRAILNKALATITPEEEERIYARHLTPDIENALNWGAWRKLALGSIWIGAIIISAIAFWNYCLFRQIRQRKAAEAALREARDRLEHRTHELDAQVTEARRLNTELLLANQDLESFSSSVSHDLRSPVRRIGSFADLLQAEVEHRISSEANQWMSTIIQESRHMDRLIHDLLQFSRVGRAELHKQPLSLQELIRDLIDEFNRNNSDRNVVWEVGELCEVEGDPNLLRYALGNLIDNALKYTRRVPEARIQIDILPHTPDKSTVVVFVRDNGCGFDMSRSKYLFGPFQRLHSSREYEGTGMGLATVKRIIQKHGGRIWAQSEPNKGATFYFTLTCSTANVFAI